MKIVSSVILAAIALILHLPKGTAQSSVPDLTGLWEAKVRSGPDIKGPLLVLGDGRSWTAEIAGLRVIARNDNNAISFQLPDDKGYFRGRLSAREIVGHWFGPRSFSYATPVTLRQIGTNRWRGEVIPLENTTTFYMPMTRRPDGTYATYLRNPERNLGRFISVSWVRINEAAVELVGRRGTEANAVIAKGVYDEGTIRVPLAGRTFDFTKVDKLSSSAFYPRGHPPERYAYAKPVTLDDGWPVATPEEVGISRAGIEKFVRMLIDMPMDSINSWQVHSLLIARRGKLVVEEYFHGYDRFTPHDTRSASKSWTAVLLGAAIHAGVPIKTTTPVYQTMLGSLPPDLDPRKRAMTLEHLISMTAGYHCSGEDAPGDETVMQQQREEPDWYRYTLNVPMLTAPGDTIVYCDIEPNLAAGMLQKIAREPLPEMFHRLVAKPMRMNRYHLQITPTGDAYGAGGHYFVPRDFMKLAQLMLNRGKWEGRQITSSEWAIKSGSPLRNLTRTQTYGWLWNSLQYSYGDSQVHALFAGGNGGQIFMAIPALELVIAFTGGNYSQTASFRAQREFIPRYILPAID